MASTKQPSKATKKEVEAPVNEPEEVIEIGEEYTPSKEQIEQWQQQFPENKEEETNPEENPVTITEKRAEVAAKAKLDKQTWGTLPMKAWQKQKWQSDPTIRQVDTKVNVFRLEIPEEKAAYEELVRDINHNPDGSVVAVRDELCYCESRGTWSALLIVRNLEFLQLRN